MASYYAFNAQYPRGTTGHLQIHLRNKLKFNWFLEPIKLTINQLVKTTKIFVYINQLLLVKMTN